MTHEETRRRRAEFARMVAEGATLSETAQTFHVDPSRVREACHAHGVTWKTRRGEESQQLRAAIGRCVADGTSIGNTAQRFNVSLDLVYKTCREQGVKWTHEQGIHPFEILAALRKHRTLQQAADDVGVTRQRAHQIKDQAVEFGVLDWVDRRPNRR